MTSGRLLLLGIVALVLVGAGIAVAISEGGDEGDVTERRSITASGTAERRATPDLAEISLGVTARAGTSEEATAAASRALRDVIAAVRRAGVSELETDPVRVGQEPIPRPEGGQEPAERPFVGRQSITVRLRETERAGEVIDAAVQAGATEVDGPRFELGDPSEARRRALDGAVADARKNAEAMAAAADVQLGRALRIEQRDGGGPQPFDTRQESAGATPPVDPGPVELEANVRVTFAIE